MTGLDLKFTAVLTLFSSTLYIMCTSQSQATETCSTEEMRRAAVNELLILRGCDGCSCGMLYIQHILSIGYTLRCRSLRNLHYQGPQVV